MAETKDDFFDVPSFDRYPRINDDMKKVGMSKTVRFCDDGRYVSKEILMEAAKKAGKKAFPRDSRVFVVEDTNENMKELWISTNSFSNRRELSKIRDSNGGTLVDAKVRITRIAEKDPDNPNWKFEGA